MSNLTKFLLLTICVSLAACNQTAEKPKPRMMDEKPPVVVETPDFSLVESETDDEANDLPPATPEVQIDPEEGPIIEEPSFSMKEIQSTLADFKLNGDSQYLSCAYYAVKGCEGQTIYQKSQEEKDASLCDLLSDGEVDSCKDNLWRSLASMEKDLSLCEKISDDFAQIDCQNSYHLSQAVAEKNASLCEKISAFPQPEAPVLDPVVGPDGEPIAADPVEAAEVVEPENYLLEDCKRQVEFAIELNVEEPVIDPALEPVPEIPAIEVGVPEGAAPEEVITTPEVLIDPVEITFPPEGEIPPEDPAPVDPEA